MIFLLQLLSDPSPSESWRFSPRTVHGCTAILQWKLLGAETLRILHADVQIPMYLGTQLTQYKQ